MPGDQRRVGAETAHPDHRIVRVRIDVDIRSEVEVAAGLPQLPAHRAGHGLGVFQVVDPSEDGVARVGRTGPLVQPGDIPTLLVDGDQGVRIGLADLVGELAQLRAGEDVVAEDAHAGETPAQPGREPLRQRGSDETGKQHRGRIRGGGLLGIACMHAFSKAYKQIVCNGVLSA